MCKVLTVNVNPLVVLINEQFPLSGVGRFGVEGGTALFTVENYFGRI